MYKVLFAEDEILVRLGLKNSINWSKYNMEVVADVEDGQIAYEKFLELKPDLIITDIRMKRMDGCELIKKIREKDKVCAIIVISCLDDFNLLRDMMQYNLLAYILKAVMTMEEIEATLIKAEDYLVQIADREKPSADCIPQKFDAALKQYLVSGSLDFGGFKQLCEQYGFDISVPFKTLLLFRIIVVNKGIINDLGIAFIQSVVSDTIHDNVTFAINDEYFALLSYEHITCNDSRLCRISQVAQSFLDVALSIVVRELEPSYAALQTQFGEECHLNMMLNGEMSNGKSSTPDNAIQKSIDYILSNNGKNITLSDIADYVGLSPNYFSTLFKKETGYSYVSFLNNIRIEKAKLLLVNTNEYLYEISENIGFNTFEYFNRLFKAKAGISPGEWRKLYKK